MRPVFSLRNVIAVLMLAYGLAIAATPGGGAVGYLAERTFVTPTLLSLTFLVCGAVILILRPSPAGLALLSTPILIYGVASLLYFFTLTSGAFAAVVSHCGLWLVIQAALYDRARGVR
jgi:hypothetical protein